MKGRQISLAGFLLFTAFLLVLSGQSAVLAPLSGFAAAAGDKVAMPANPVVWQKGQVYKIGQAVKDPKSGLVFMVSAVRFDNKLPGLSAGYEWALIDLTLGNVGKQYLTVRPLGDLGIKAEGEKSFLTEPVYADRELEDKAGATPMVNTDVPPGQAVRALLTIKVPVAGKGLVLWYAQGLIIGRNAPDSALFEISLGR